MWGRNIHNMKWQDSANTAARWHGWTGREVFTPGTSRGGEEVLFEHLIWRIVFSGGSQHLHRIFHPVMAHPGAVAFTYVCTRSIWQLIQIQIFYKLSIVEDFYQYFPKSFSSRFTKYFWFLSLTYRNTTSSMISSIYMLFHASCWWIHWHLKLPNKNISQITVAIMFLLNIWPLNPI